MNRFEAFLWGSVSAFAVAGIWLAVAVLNRFSFEVTAAALVAAGASFTLMIFARQVYYETRAPAPRPATTRFRHPDDSKR